MIEYWTALTIGALGSFHCVGMCGPIALALPIQPKSGSSKFLGGLTYNLGRIFTYAIFGAIFGSIGKGFTFFGTQQYLSIALGILILLSVLIPFGILNKINPNSYISRFIGQLKGGMRKFLMQRSYKSLLTIGLLNGLLPCGLVYIGIAGAIGTGNPLNGAIFMALFGLGTLPIMFGVTLLGNLISIKIRTLVRKSFPVIVACIGILFIVRGLNFGIPYLSPKAENDQVIECCH